MNRQFVNFVGNITNIKNKQLNSNLKFLKFNEFLLNKHDFNRI